VCPDPTLLVAYLDGTLFHRDREAVDRHLAGCAACAALISNLRLQREAAHASRTWRFPAIIAAGVILVSAVGVGLWRPWAGPGDVPRRPVVPRVVDAPPVDAPPRAASPARSAPLAQPPPAIPQPEAAAEPPAASVAPAPVTTPAVPRVLWRTRELAVESSTDGGKNWMTEHTADRPIRAAAFVDANVAWVVGDSGLILRRTKNGWFAASPPAEADANLTGVRASSPSSATITLADGRVFRTTNGGVTWLPVP
jgi:hypothetical protein